MESKECRDNRKAAIEERRIKLNDKMVEVQDEISETADAYGAILDEERAEEREEEERRKREGFVKLWEVPNKTWVSLSRHPETLFFFDHVDGAYSYCLTICGKLQHIGASTFVLVHDLILDTPEGPAPTPGQYRTS
jgi:hypothetical protein